MRKYQVSIVQGDEVFFQVKEALDLIGGIQSFVKEGSRVLLKPNMTGPSSFEKGVTTNPAVVKALAFLAYEAGACVIDIGDGTGSIHIGSRMVMKLCGMEEIVTEYGGKLVDLNAGKMEVIPVPEGKILKSVKVSKTFFSYDVVINIPVLKTHFITEVSLGMKNLKGCIPPAEKRRFHDVGVNPAVADLNKVIRTSLTIMDGTIAGEGLGPKEGKAVGFKTVLAGENVLAIDMVSAAVMGFQPLEIDHVRMAMEHGIGPESLEQIEVFGLTVDQVRRKFLPAIPSMPDTEQAEIQNFQSCSGCMGCAAITISRLQDMGFFELEPERKLQLVIGTKIPKEFVPETEAFFIGNCAMRNRKDSCCIPGCAPSALDAANSILDFYQIPHRPYV